MASLFEDYKAQFRKPGNHLTQLILINITVFVVYQLVALIDFFSFQKTAEIFIIPNIALTSNLSVLVFKPWTIITSFFTHFGLMNILFNMLSLYWFGFIVSDLIGQKKMLATYVLGGLAGGIAFILLFNFVPTYAGNINAQLVGASGAVFALSTAAATISPDYTIRLFLIGPVKLKYLVGVYIFISILGLKGSNAGGDIAHLGGALMGFIYVRTLRNGTDLGKFVYVILEFFSKPTSLFQRKPKMKVTHNTFSSSNTTNTNKTTTIVSQFEIDAILDKISNSGYESLTKEEKEKLFKASKKE